MKYSISTFLLILILQSAFFSCARRGRPTGGAKDTIPPVLIKTIPAEETVNFKGNKIKIYFDEYIKLNEVTKNLVVSPPQKNNPIITPVGTASKFITIKIVDTLKKNTTYAFNFGNSIVDNNEGNKLGNFKYVFSTGSYIDSLNLTGEVSDPIVKESVKNIDVMLYEYTDTFTDSIIYKEKPSYIANTLDSTLFELTNLRAGKYLLIALKDANNNKIYNPKTDKIGFVSDTITLPTDKKYTISIFKETLNLKVFNPKETSKGHLIFGYEGDARNLKIDLLSEVPSNFKSEIVFEKNKDTINYWYTPFKSDSLQFSVSKGAYSNTFVVKTRNSKIDSLKISNNTGQVLHLLDTFSISSNVPIAKIDTSLIKIIDKDSAAVKFNTFLTKSDTKLYLNFDKKYNNKYHFELLPKAITDIFGVTNDTIKYKTNTRTVEDYGNLNIIPKISSNASLIIELIDSKKEVVRRAKIKQAKKVTFNLLPPGEYVVRIIIDKNNNGRWDTGSFLDKRQPEVVKYLKKTIELRANWDINEVFNLD